MTSKELREKYGMKGKLPPQTLIARLEFNMKQVQYYQAQVEADRETIKKYLEGDFDEKTQ